MVYKHPLPPGQKTVVAKLEDAPSEERARTRKQRTP